MTPLQEFLRAFCTALAIGAAAAAASYLITTFLGF